MIGLKEIGRGLLFAFAAMIAMLCAASSFAEENKIATAEADVAVKAKAFFPCDRSPGGRFMLGIAAKPGEEGRLMWVDTTGNLEPETFDAKAAWGKISPDGKRIAFLKTGQKGLELWTVNVKGGEKKLIAGHDKIFGQAGPRGVKEGAAIDWSASSMSVYVAWSVSSDPGRLKMFRVDMDGKVSSAVSVDSIPMCGEGPIRSIEVNAETNQALFVADSSKGPCLAAVILRGGKMSDVSVAIPGATRIEAFFDVRGEFIYVLTDGALAPSKPGVDSAEKSGKIRTCLLKLSDWNITAIDGMDMDLPANVGAVLMKASPDERFIDQYYTAPDEGGTRVHIYRRVYNPPR